MTAPTPGRVVLYRLGRDDVEKIRYWRSSGGNGLTPPQHWGNPVHEGDQFPADIIRVFPGGVVNLQVKLDGNDTHWATSKSEGAGPGTWSWPPRGEAKVDPQPFKVEDEAVERVRSYMEMCRKSDETRHTPNPGAPSGVDLTRAKAVIAAFLDVDWQAGV